MYQEHMKPLPHQPPAIRILCAGAFLFFICFGLSMILLQLAFEVVAFIYGARQQRKLRQLRHRGGGFVELPPLADSEFAHFPGLEPSPCYHLFLSHAWPRGQDVCKLIKQRCREICPSLHVFLDVEDLTSGYGAESVDSSQCILVFAMHVYFEKINCVRELVRAIVRNKPITLLLPDAEVHGEFTQAMIAEILTDEWMQKWKLEKKTGRVGIRLGCGQGQGADGRGNLQHHLQAAAARVVAHHAIPGPHDGAHVPATAARGEARHLPAGRVELQAAQEAHASEAVL
jgi:hypothetical protein